MGVTKVNNKFRARYTENGRRINVGMFTTKKEAEEALHRHKNLGGLEYEEIPIGEPLFQVSKPTLRERVVTKWRSIKKSLERKNLI